MTKIKNLMKPPEPSEQQIQKNIIKFCDLMSGQYPELNLINASMNGLWIPHTHAGIKEKIIQQFKWRIIKILQAVGCLRKGFPDLNLPVARGKWHALYIELKKSNNEKPTDDQIWWLRRLTAEGNYACVCYGEGHAKATLIEYLRGCL